MSRADIIVAAAVAALVEGHVLHVRAERVPASRKRRTHALGPVDLTVGPDARGAFLVVDYIQVRSGREDAHPTATEAVRAVRRLLAWGRIQSLFAALVAIYGPPEKCRSRFVDDARQIAAGARMRVAFAGRKPLVGPLFGPGFGPFGR